MFNPINRHIPKNNEMLTDQTVEIAAQKNWKYVLDGNDLAVATTCSMPSLEPSAIEGAIIGGMSVWPGPAEADMVAQSFPWCVNMKHGMD